MIGLNYLGKMGQLGNQMFQYAALRGIADRRGLEYTVPNHDEVLEDGLGINLVLNYMMPLILIQRIKVYYQPMNMFKRHIFILIKIYIMSVQITVQ